MSMTPETPLPPKSAAVALRPLPMLIFSSRWLQLPLYIGLIVAQGVYVVLFLKELWHLIGHSFDFTEQQIMLVVLGLIDVVMISNLLVMVIVGGYETFVSRLNLKGHPDEPEWLATSTPAYSRSSSRWRSLASRRSICCGPSSRPETLATRRGPWIIPETGVMWQTIIHVVFIFSAIGIALASIVSRASEANVAHGEGGALSMAATTGRDILRRCATRDRGPVGARPRSCARRRCTRPMTASRASSLRSGPTAQKAGVSRATFDSVDSRTRARLQTARPDPARYGPRPVRRRRRNSFRCRRITQGEAASRGWRTEGQRLMRKNRVRR